MTNEQATAVPTSADLVATATVLDAAQVTRQDRVLMARSVWSRSPQPLAQRSSQRIEAMLEQLQPRRRPLPTPSAPP